MPPESKGSDLFIVDNGVSSRAGMRYVEEWSRIADTFDVATITFEISARPVFNVNLQRFHKIQILFGTETTHRTRKSLVGAPAVEHEGRRSPMSEHTTG